MYETGLKAVPSSRRTQQPVVIGHRGASAYRPEHTRASFELAIDMGADFIEPDVVVSRDGELVVRHESELSLTTDVAARPEFADRRTTRCTGGVAVTDWFVEDFDLEELRTLRAVERSPEVRPLNATYDGQLGLMTLSEVFDLARSRSGSGRTVGVLVELVPRLTGPGRALPELVTDELRRQGMTSTGSPVMLQAFEPSLLRRLRASLGTDGPEMLQLIGYGEEWQHFLTADGLDAISAYADGVAPSHHRFVSAEEHEILPGALQLVRRAHERGLAVYSWTLCPENAFLPPSLRLGDSPAGHGRGSREVELVLGLGVDGLITDAPDVAVRVRDKGRVSQAA
jgi:glycerophosphoryl diester phosphodiesterase